MAKTPHKRNFRQEVTDEIIAQIEKGTAPWQKPWRLGEAQGLPHNPISKTVYQGMNSIILDMKGHVDPRWLTYKQAESLGAKVRAGSKGTQIEFWKWSGKEPVLDEKGEPVLDEEGKQKLKEVRYKTPKVFYAVVFNAEQIEGLEPYKKPDLQFDPIERAEEILKGSNVTIEHRPQDRAFYSLGQDRIQLPPREAFKTASSYYETALHELGHATGHHSRLNRDMSGGFGSATYAKEELRAEIASYMIARQLGIGHDPSQHASYVESWLKALKEDKNEIFRASKDAEKISQWILEPSMRLELEKQAQQASKAKEVEETELVQEQSVEKKQVLRPEKVFVHWSEASGIKDEKMYDFWEFEKAAYREAVNSEMGYWKTKVTIYLNDGTELQRRLDLSPREDKGFRSYCQGTIDFVNSERFKQLTPEDQESYKKEAEFYKSIDFSYHGLNQEEVEIAKRYDGINIKDFKTTTLSSEEVLKLINSKGFDFENIEDPARFEIEAKTVKTLLGGYKLKAGAEELSLTALEIIDSKDKKFVIYCPNESYARMQVENWIEDRSNYIKDTKAKYAEEEQELKKEEEALKKHLTPDVFMPKKYDLDTYSQRLNEFLRGELKGTSLIRLGTTPMIYDVLNFEPKILVVSASVLEKATSLKHNVGLDVLSNLPILVSNPAMVFKSRTNEDSFVAILEAQDKDNKNIVAIIKKTDGKYNVIPSFYGKDEFKKFIETNIAENNLLYLDKEKALKLSDRYGLQLPAGDMLKSHNNNVLFKEDIVNKYQKQLQEISSAPFEKQEPSREKNTMADNSKALRETLLVETIGGDKVYIDKNSYENPEKSKCVILDKEGNTLDKETIDKLYKGASSVHKENITKILTKERTYLEIPYTEKSEAKALGARWDKIKKSWYVKDGTDLEPFKKWQNQELTPTSKLSPQAEFKIFLNEHGFEIKGEPVMDGKWQRCPAEGDKKGKLSGSYIGSADGVPNGQINNFKTGEKAKWTYLGQALTEEEKQRQKEKFEQARKERKASLEKQYRESAKKAYGVFEHLKTEPTKENCPYLAKKQVNAYGVKANDKGELVIPARDSKGFLWSIQTVSSEQKGFLGGSRKAGTMHVIDQSAEKLADIKSRSIFVAEGYATAASIHEAIKAPVVVAFDAYNLEKVAKEIRTIHPESNIVICADNDHKKDNNVGIEQANKAAKEVSAKVIVPEFNEAEKAKGLSDFNDLANSRGLSAVKDMIASKLSLEVSKIMSQEELTKKVDEILEIDSSEKKAAVSKIMSEEEYNQKIINLQKEVEQEKAQKPKKEQDYSLAI